MRKNNEAKEHKIKLAELMLLDEEFAEIFLETALKRGLIPSNHNPKVESFGKTNFPAYFLTELGQNKLELQLLRDNLVDSKIINKINERDFKMPFSGSTKTQINFVRKGKPGGGGLSDVLWFMYFMWEDFELVKQESDYLVRLANCFLLDGEPILIDKKN